MSVTSTPGLLLVGFFEERPATSVLNTLCVCADTRPHALKAIWQSARKTRSGRVKGAGTPDIRDVPAELQEHAAKVAGLERLKDGIEGMAFEVKLVEVAPLLAYQAGVYVGRVDRMVSDLGAIPTLTRFAELCLPLDARLDFSEISLDLAAPMRVLSRNPNVAVVRSGHGTPDPVSGVLPMVFLIGVREPCVQVVEFKGKCYLRNGYHRALAAMRAGATHVPALVVRGRSWADVHAELGKGWFLDPRTLGEDTPTISHFLKATSVPLRLWEHAIALGQTLSSRPI